MFKSTPQATKQDNNIRPAFRPIKAVMAFFYPLPKEELQHSFDKTDATLARTDALVSDTNSLLHLMRANPEDVKEEDLHKITSIKHS